MSNDDDECDSSSLLTMATQSDVNSFLRAQAAKITSANTSISDDDENSMDGSLLARFTQMPSESKSVASNVNRRANTVKPYLSRSCFASLTSSSPNKSTPSKVYASDDLTELKWLQTFKLKEFKEDLSVNDSKSKESDEKNTSQQQDSSNNDEDRLAKLISELKSYDNESTKVDTNSFGVLLFLALYSQKDEKSLAWSLTIKQFYEYAQMHAKQITSKRGWKNLLRQALLTIPCFVKTKRDLLKSRSLWTIDPYYRPLLTKAYLSIPPISSSAVANKTLSEVATNRHDDQAATESGRNSQSAVNNFAPKATVKTKVLPRLYERLCEEKAIDADSDDEEDDEADSHFLAQKHGNSHRKRPRSSSTSGNRQSLKDGKRRSSTSPWNTKLLKKHKRRQNRNEDNDPKTSTPNRKLNTDHRSPIIANVVTPCPSSDHSYFLEPNQEKDKTKKDSTLERTKSTGSIEYNDPSPGDDTDEDDERDSSSASFVARKSIITTRAQAAARTHSHNRRKSSPPKKRTTMLLPPHRPNTRISRKIIEQDLKLLRQANVLPPLSPPSNQQPLDLSLGPSNRSSSFEEPTEKTSTQDKQENLLPQKMAPIEGVLDLSLSR